MKVIFTKQAENDLEQIADMPKAFPIVSELPELNIRRRVYQNYSIFFCIEVEGIFIVRILNSTMNYTALFES